MKGAKSILTAAVLYTALVLCGCMQGADIACPIPEQKMTDPDPGWVPFNVVNESCISFCSLLIAPTGCDDWGLDWIGVDSLPPGEEWPVKLPPGRYDILLEDCTQQQFIWEKIDILEESEFTLSGEAEYSDACQHSLTVENHTQDPVCYMWIAAPYSESFGANWLGNDSIQPGGTRTFIAPEGTYDLKAESCDFTLLRVELDVHISGDVIWSIPE